MDIAYEPSLELTSAYPEGSKEGLAAVKEYLETQDSNLKVDSFLGELKYRKKKSFNLVKDKKKKEKEYREREEKRNLNLLQEIEIKIKE